MAEVREELKEEVKEDRADLKGVARADPKEEVKADPREEARADPKAALSISTPSSRWLTKQHKEAVKAEVKEDKAEVKVAAREDTVAAKAVPKAVLRAVLMISTLNNNKVCKCKPDSKEGNKDRTDNRAVSREDNRAVSRADNKA